MLISNHKVNERAYTDAYVTTKYIYLQSIGKQILNTMNKVKWMLTGRLMKEAMVGEKE